MSSLGINLEKYRIPLQQIIRATNNFSSETQIGDGGFGMVYKGQLSENGQNRTVAIKRLNRDGCQGKDEFHNELKMVSSFDHPNIITFIGYCDEANELIIVYDYAINKSLDLHLQDPDKRRCITWSQRLQICLGAARGLKYLHSGLGENVRVIHRDLKSANILLDENLQAKICDFGLSRFGPRNQDRTYLLTRAAGTRHYMDPVDSERNRFSKESDVYSFGVVLFEMSSGMLVYHGRCFGDDKERYLLDLVRSYYDDYEDDGLDKLIDPIIKDDINMKSFHTLNEIAHQCINLDSKKRPTMDRIIEEIEKALDIQDHGPVDQPMTQANGTPTVVDPQLPHVHFPSASIILEDLLGPLAIEDHVSGYTIKSIRDIAQCFDALCLKDSGVLYEDSNIQIGIIAEWQNHQGRLTIFLGNMNTTATLDSVQAVILPQSHLKLGLLKVPETIPPRTQIQCRLEVVNLHPSRDATFLDFSYKLGTQLVNKILRLPTVLNKLLNPIQVPTDEFLSKWRSLVGPPLKLQEVVRGVRDISLEEMANLLNGLRLIVCPGVDLNKNNLVATTTFYSESTQYMLCWVRIETYPADRTKLRITVASGDPTVTSELKELIKEHFIRIPTQPPSKDSRQ